MTRLILLYFRPEKKKPRIQGGHVTYKTKNIKHQNKSLNLGKKPSHIKFDSDGNPIDLKPSKTLNKVRNFFGRVIMQSALENDDLVPGPVLAYKSFKEADNVIVSDSDELTDSVNDAFSAMDQTATRESKTAFTECSNVQDSKENKSADCVKCMDMNSKAEQFSELGKSDTKREKYSKEEYRRRKINAKLGIGDLSRYFSSKASSQNETECHTGETGKDDESSVVTSSQQVTVTEHKDVQMSSHDDELKDVQSLSHGIVENIIDRLLDSVTVSDVDSKNENNAHFVKIEKGSDVSSNKPEAKPQNNMTEKEFKESRKRNLVRRKMGMGDLSQYFTADDGMSEEKSDEKSEIDIKINELKENVLELKSPDDSMSEEKPDGNSENRIKINESKDNVLESKSPDLSKEVNIQNVQVDKESSQNENETNDKDELLNSGAKTNKPLSESEVKDMRKKHRVRCKLGIGDISQFFTTSDVSSEEKKTEDESVVTSTEGSTPIDTALIKDFKSSDHANEPDMENDNTVSTNDGKLETDSLSETVKHKLDEKEMLISELLAKQKALLGDGLYNIEEELEIGEKFDPILHSDINPDDYIDEEAYEAYMAAKKKKRKRRKVTPMPPEIADDPELKKYWGQRYRLFSKFDEGIQMDKGKKINRMKNYYLKLLTVVLRR